ncbi:MAG: DnaK suppressor protein [Actinomycetota bacterium]|jgi:DnaK suppressor protein|nr:DnaK suppressor protein [Actinomycetota bacterium]
MDELKKRLEDKRTKLRDEMARVSAPPEQTGGISFGKRVGEGTSFAVERLVQVATHDRDQAVLADVERALIKIEEGTYGVCDVCGTAIAPARLDALPWAVVCVDCAAK